MIRYLRDGVPFSAGEVVDGFLDHRKDLFCSLAPNNHAYGQEATYRWVLNAYLLGDDLAEIYDPIVAIFDNDWLPLYQVELEKK